MLSWLLGRRTNTFWTLSARRHLDAAQVGNATPPDSVLAQLERLLRCAFDGAHQIVVHTLYTGFRTGSNQFVLLAEVERPQKGRLSVRPYVVKAYLGARASDLAREWRAWDSCKPHSFDHDHVLMSLEPVLDGRGNIVALVYEDARQAIGGERVVPFENAVVDAALYGNPSVSSVRDVLVQLFYRLDQLLYHGSKDRPVTTFPTNPPLADYVAAWQRPAGNPKLHPARGWVRQVCNHGGTTVPGRGPIDPVDYLAYVRQVLEGGAHAGAQPLDPTTRRGRAHGDLHGRNVRGPITKPRQTNSSPRPGPVTSTRCGLRTGSS